MIEKEYGNDVYFVDHGGPWLFFQDNDIANSWAPFGEERKEVEVIGKATEID